MAQDTDALVGGLPAQRSGEVIPDFVPFTYGLRPEPQVSGPKPRVLFPSDHRWISSAAVRLRARGVADDEVNAILTETVDTFVRRGRVAKDVYGRPGQFVEMHPRGSVQHRGHRLRTLVGYPLLGIAVVLAVLAALSSPLPVLAPLAVVALVGGLWSLRSGYLIDAEIPAHLSRGREPFRG